MAPTTRPQWTASKLKQRRTVEKPKQGETANTRTQQEAEEQGPPYFGPRPPFDAPFGAVWQKVATTTSGRINVDDKSVVGHWKLFPDTANFT